MLVLVSSLVFEPWELFYINYIIIENIIFTIVPTTQYVWINQAATFTCATNNGTLIITVSGVSDAHIMDAIDLPEGGQLRTATFTVTAANNGSAAVRCLVQPQGSVSFISSATVTAYAQGNCDTGVDNIIHNL